MTGAAIVLALFAVVGTGMVAAIYEGTKERIAENERQALLESLFTIVPQDRLDNDIVTDNLIVTDREMLGTPNPVTVYRARKDGKPVAAVLAPVAPDGYSGNIRLLVGINHDGTLAGVRVIAHKETPGLGDPIEAQKSDWIFGFNDKSLSDPEAAGWAVKKDGGIFDQFTGATITPRAVVNAVHRSLQYFNAHRDELFVIEQVEEANKDG